MSKRKETDFDDLKRWALGTIADATEETANQVFNRVQWEFNKFLYEQGASTQYFDKIDRGETDFDDLKRWALGTIADATDETANQVFNRVQLKLNKFLYQQGAPSTQYVTNAPAPGCPTCRPGP